MIFVVRIVIEQQRSQRRSVLGGSLCCSDRQRIPLRK
nr:MAG TPA: hypothetical protein [Bacteriophage sp.]